MSGSDTFEPDQVLVRLRGLPVELHREATAHLDGIRREFDVLMVGDDAGTLPERLRVLMEEIDESRGGDSDGDLPDFLASVAVERDQVDVDVWMPVESVVIVERFNAVLDEVEQYCRSGEHLMTLAMSPRALAYRRWLLSEFIHQVAGASPQPWNERAALAALSDVERAQAQPAADDGGAGDVDPVGASPPRSAPVEPAGPEVSVAVVPEGWSVEHRGTEVAVGPTGELDLESAPLLRDLVQSLRRDRIRGVELDLSAVTFVDSVGLGMLVSANQRLDADGVTLAVLVPRRLRRVFELSGLDRVLDVRDV